MKIEQVGAFVATVASLSTFTYGYSFSDVSTAKNTPVESTGLTTNEESRIYGGSEANIDKYPFLVSLRDSLFDETFCGGTLIAPQYILTAGHCIKTDEMDIVATFGTNDSTGSGSGEATQFPVIAGFRHPLYKKKEHLYDLGLLKLKKPIKRKTAKLCAADGSSNKVGTMATVLGWGKTEDGSGLGSPTLEQLTIPVISNAECGKFKKYVGRVTDGMLCAGTGNGRDTCNGDSGGPLLVDGNILIGCVSWGSKCGQQAGIFTRLTYVMDYIEDILAGGDGSKFNVTSSSDSSMDEVSLPSSSDGSSESTSGSAEAPATKGKATKAPVVEDASDSGSDDLSWLLDSASGSGSDDMSWLLKLLNGDSNSGSMDLSWLFGSYSDSSSGYELHDDDLDSGSEDTVPVKGGKSTKALKASKSTKTPIEESSDDSTSTSASTSESSDSAHQSDLTTQQETFLHFIGYPKTRKEATGSLRLAYMGQAGSVQQKSALRDVLSLRRPNVSNTELEEVLRTFCALFPLELQVPVNADPSLISSVVGVAVKERRLFDVVHGLLQDQTEQSQRPNGRDMTELILTSFRRVIRWRELYKLCAKCSLKPFLTCLYRPSPTLVLSVLETLELMLSPCPDFEAGDKAADRSETANRRNFGDAGGYEVLRSLLVQYGVAVGKEKQKEDAAAVLRGVLKIFLLTLVSRRAMTDMMTCTQAVGALMNARVSLLDLCHCREVMRLAIGLVKELFCIVDLDQVHELQESAREYGALLYALETAVQEDVEKDTIENGKEVEDGREVDLDMRELCVDLVEVFCAGNTRSKKAMYRIFPVELFIPAKNRVELISRHTAASPSSIAQTKATPGARSARTLPHFSFDFEQPRCISIATSNVSTTNGSVEAKRNRVVALAYNAMNFGGGAFERWLGDARAKGEHWREIIEAVGRTHESPELVWRAPMRAELRQALQGEIETLERRRRYLTENETAQFGEQIPRWDHDMFYVEYPSMHEELVVNDYFVEYLIPRVADLTTTYEIAEPVVLAWHLSDQLAIEHDEKWALLCVRCLRLVIRRYAMLFHGQLPTQYVLLLLRDHMNHSPVFVRECFLLLNTAVITTRNTPSESFNQLCTTVTRTIVGVLADPVLLATLSTPLELDDEADQDNFTRLVEPEDEAVAVVNERDGLLRAGISVLLAIVRRAKFVLRFVRPKRMFLCRLLAVETLDHVTITRLLFVLKQLALLDNNGDYSTPPESGTISSRLSSASLPTSHSSSAASHTSSTADSNWRSLTLVYALLASCDPKGMGMCVATAEFLKESCAQTPNSRSGESKGTQPIASSCEFNALLNDALGFGGCGMGRLLNSVSAEVFTNTFNASQKRAADVNWGRKQRVRLYRYLKLKYLGYGEKESTASWNSFVDDDADHRYEDDDLFIGNIFLRSYIEGDGEFLNEWTPEMYSELINALFEELVLVGRRKSAYAGTGSVGPLPSPPQQLSLSQSSSSGGSCAAEPWEVQVLILKALARLVPSRCAEVKIKTEFYESLLAPLRRSMLSEVDQVRGILSLELFVSVLSVPETRSVNTAACRLFLEEKGLRALADSLERMRSPAYQQVLQTVEVFGPRRRSNPSTQNMARVLLYRSTDVLSILAKQQAAGIQAITKNPEVVTALIELASRQIIMQYADVDAASVCLSCLGGLCHYDELRALVVNAGGMLSLLDTIAFCPAEELDKASARESQVTDERSESDTSDAEDGQEENAKDEQTHDPKKTKSEGNSNGSSAGEVQRIPSRFFGAIRSAALVLRACLGPKNAPVPSLPTQVLYQLLTPSFVRVLRTSPDQFILELQTTDDISTATLIWTVSMRQRLQKCITTELAKVKAAAASKTWPRWNPEHFVAADSFRYQYPELADVLVLHDVYLANFVATPVEDLDLGDIDMASFSEALLISIQSHENVLRILQERGSSDSTKEAAVRLMRQTLDKLVSKHPQHNLEVDASRGVPISDGSPVMSPTTATSVFSPETLAAAVHTFSPTDDRDWDITRIERCSSSGIEDLTV